MTKSQKEINDVMVQVLEQVIFPRFDQLDEKIEGVRTELMKEVRSVEMGLKGETQGLKEKIEVLDEKIGILDEKVDYTNRRFDVLIDEFKDHDKRITKLELRVGFVAG